MDNRRYYKRTNKMTSSEGYHEIDEGKLHYVFEEGEPFLVFIHGHGGDIDGLKRQSDFFNEKGFGVLSYDQRGCGKSLKPLSENEYSLKSYTNDLEQLLKLCKVEKATLIAHSSGTAIAQHFSHLHPETVEGLVLISLVFNTRKNLEKSSYGRSLLRTKPLIDLSTRFFETILPGPESNSTEPVQSTLATGTDVQSGARFYFSSSKKFRKALRLRLNRMMEWNLEAEARHINTPTLLIHGENDRLIDTEISRQLKQLINNSELAIINGKHEVHKQNYSEINKLILEFLKRRVYPDMC